MNCVSFTGKTNSLSGEIDSSANSVVSHIVEFLLQENGADVETLRKAMYCQVQRMRIRRQGISMILDLLRKEQLIPSAKYALLSGWLGLPLLRAAGLPQSANM